MSYIGKNLKVNTSTLNPLAADPVSPTEGMIFFSDGTSRSEGLWLYRNAAWEQIDSTANGSIYLGSEVWTDSEANVTTTVYLTRSGPYLFVEAYAPVTGVITGTDFNVTIPAGYTAATAPYANVGTARPYIGQASLSNSGATYPGTVVLTSTTNIRVFGNNDGANGNITASNPFVWGNGDYITFQARWLVQAWI